MRHGVRRLALPLALALAPAALAAPPAGTRYLVTFETTECGGGQGRASVDAAWIDRIVAAGCTGPDGRPLMQVLTRPPGATHYEAHTVTADEAGRIMEQVRAWSEARRKALERGTSVLIDRP